MGLTKEEKREYQRVYMARKRSNTGSNKEVGLTGEGLTEQGSNTGGLTRLNPATMRPYQGMASYPAEVLSEYERKWGWGEPHYESFERGYVIGDILDLKNAGYGFISRLYKLSHA